MPDRLFLQFFISNPSFSSLRYITPGDTSADLHIKKPPEGSRVKYNNGSRKICAN